MMKYYAALLLIKKIVLYNSNVSKNNVLYYNIITYIPVTNNILCLFDFQVLRNVGNWYGILERHIVTHTYSDIMYLIELPQKYDYYYQDKIKDNLLSSLLFFPMFSNINIKFLTHSYCDILSEY